MNNFAKKLIELRTNLGLTQEELAQKINVTRQTISKWERSESVPDGYNLEQLSLFFNVSIDDLMGKSKIENDDYRINFKKTGGYFKNLLYKAKHFTNLEEAKKFRKLMIILGAVLLSIGILFFLIGFLTFLSQFGSFNINITSIIFSFVLFGLGGILNIIGGFSLYVGLVVVVAGVSTNFLDDRKKCPSCNDEIDENEKFCSHCGYDLGQNKMQRCSCGNIIEKNDKFCRTCGLKAK